MEELKKDDVKEAENLPISDEQDIEDNSTETEDVEDEEDEEFIEVVGDTDEVINEKEEEVK